jgi:hypothetical protein
VLLAIGMFGSAAAERRLRLRHRLLLLFSSSGRRTATARRSAGPRPCGWRAAGSIRSAAGARSASSAPAISWPAR